MADNAKNKVEDIAEEEVVNEPKGKERGNVIVPISAEIVLTERKVGPNATDDEKAADRERRLAAPTTKHRKVFSEWPRDPNGPILRPEESKLGKMLGNKVQFWGATLMDFYYVRRIPDCPNLATISTGSKLARWMKDKGENYATDQLLRAEREPYPQEVTPYPIGGLLESLSGGFGNSQPFVKTTSLPVLQERLMYTFLPETLVVHDPHRTLIARRSMLTDNPRWDSEHDIVHTYRLQLSSSGKEKRARERNAIDIAEAAFLARTPVFFMHAARPPRSEPKEAHLYLAPSQLCGTGNHSVVYHAEWEVPRSLIVPDAICKKCVFEKGTEMLVAEDGENGETKDPKWLQKTGKVVETVYENPGFSIAAFDSNGNEVKDEHAELVTYDIEPPSRQVTRKYHGPVRVIDTGIEWQSAAYGVTCKHRAGEAGQPSSASKTPLTARVSVVAKMSIQGDDHLETEADNYQQFPTHFFQHYTGYNVISPLHDPVPVGALVPQFYGYYVPDHAVQPTFWHERKKGGKAGSAKAETEDEKMDTDATAEGVANKGEAGEELAMDVDSEEDEPEEGENKPSDDPSRLSFRYRSPILLVENCGESVGDSLDTMSADDRQECTSLYLRLHHEGWLHNSPYARNIVYQPGPVDASPLERAQNATKRPDLRKTSFRLIDFGRTERMENGRERSREEATVTQLFRVLHNEIEPGRKVAPVPPQHYY
ncbi:hypothetical protein MD484_g4875, partial [Candolleomyces efflorescens]